MNIAALADPLRETAEHHNPDEKAHPAYHWWDWCAANMSARENGRTPEEASDAAGRYMEEVLHDVPDDFAHLTALYELVHRFVLRWAHRHWPKRRRPTQHLPRPRRTGGASALRD